ncbi:hypothetical protein Tco_1495450, partial [Tanacetum coccineum]
MGSGIMSDVKSLWRFRNDYDLRVSDELVKELCVRPSAVVAQVNEVDFDDVGGEEGCLIPTSSLGVVKRMVEEVGSSFMLLQSSSVKLESENHENNLSSEVAS